ncbi:UTP--glucose-1-phosphate uridylyltransferase, partial [Micrococcus sp. SIMBA_144]
GRYVLTPEIFEILETLPTGAGGEVQLTDAIKVLNESQAVVAHEFEGDGYDVGDKFGFIKATVDFALGREDLQDEVMAYLKSVVEKELSYR